MRHAAQCLGRVLRGKDDYGIMVLADRRFQKKRNQLPKWINQSLLEADTSLSTDMAVATAKKFLRTMSQPFSNKDQDGVSSWSLEDLERHKVKIDEDNIRELRDEMEMQGVQQNGGGDSVRQQGGIGEDEYGDDEMDDEVIELFNTANG